MSTKEQILEILKTVVDPRLGCDYVSARMVKVSDDAQEVQILLGYPAKNVIDEVRAQVQTAFDKAGLVVKLDVKQHIVAHAVQRTLKVLPNVKNISNMFFECSMLTNLNLNVSNTSNVTNMSNMFRNCSKLTKIDMSSFDTSSVTNMGNLFSGCSSLTSLDIRNFNFTNVTNHTNILINTPSGITIYVKDEAAKEFILNLKSNANVIIPESV